MGTLALLLLLADAPTPEQMAKLQHDIQAAQDDVDKKYSGKELSPEEKKQQIKDRAAAENSVLENAGVDRKDYARSSARMSKEDRAAVSAEKDKLDKKDKAGSGAGTTTKENGVVVEKGGKGQGQLTPEEEAAAADRAAGYGKGSSSSGGKSKRR